MSDNEKLSSTDADALEFHRASPPGKVAMIPTKPMATQRDLALAYSPGVAAPVRAIADNPDAVYDYTSKGNTVAVVSNGTAILGLGNLGAATSKPVMAWPIFCRSCTGAASTAPGCAAPSTEASLNIPTTRT